MQMSPPPGSQLCLFSFFFPQDLQLWLSFKPELWECRLKSKSHLWSNSATRVQMCICLTFALSKLKYQKFFLKANEEQFIYYRLSNSYNQEWQIRRSDLTFKTLCKHGARPLGLEVKYLKQVQLGDLDDWEFSHTQSFNLYKHFELRHDYKAVCSCLW